VFSFQAGRNCTPRSVCFSSILAQWNWSQLNFSYFFLFFFPLSPPQTILMA